MNYTDFIQKKIIASTDCGFDVVDLNPSLFEFQKFVVTKALKKGKYALFMDCGLGKTICQLEWGNKVSLHSGKPVLIIAPLAVSRQTIQEGLKFGYDVKRATKSVQSSGLYITNYEQLDNINCGDYSGVVLDESGILKNYEGAIKQKIISEFASTPYKLCCTATPSPNDPMELGNHAEFLNIMSRNEMLSMYFIHDGGETSKWRLKKHAHKSFYGFVSTWAVMMTSPHDIGFDMDGYELPPLNIIEKQIATDTRDNGMLFNEAAVSATNFNAELRITKVDRLSQVCEIVNGSNEQFIVWVKQNEESEYCTRMIDGAMEVKGSDDAEYKERTLLAFANNEYRVLVTKSKICQFGMNFQNCHNQIFASLDFSFESLYQSIRRSYRFGQTKPVNIYIVTTDTMQNVISSIKTKEQQFRTMQMEMATATSENLNIEFNKVGAMECADETTDKYRLMFGDCVERIREIEDNSVGFSIFSPPFADLYTYSNDLRDMGNSSNYDEFVKHFSYLVPELYRVIKEGRNIAVHCMDIPIQKGKHGYIGLRDFSGLLLGLFADAGFIYHSRVTIWKDPVVEMQRTKALGLLHKQIKKDSTMSRVGIPDYLLIFRKDGDRTDPVTNDNMPVDLWQKYASPVWMDIDYGDTLQYRSARDGNDEKHICPLQLPTIERAIHLYTNENDIVLTPFMGIGSEVYQAIKMNRRGIGIELKASYYNTALKNVRSIASKIENEMSLFSDAL